MKISISQLPMLGVFIERMVGLPKELGVELLFEAGNDYYWSHNIQRVMKDREGCLSVHGPFSCINLADPEADWDAIREDYIACFRFCAEYHAVHCVCHPDAKTSRPDLDTAIRRIVELDSIARTMNVQLLVENLPPANTVFTEEVFHKLASDYEQLCFLLDTGHAILSGWNLPETVKWMGRRLKGIHVHEPVGDKDVHLPVGSGYYNWNPFFAAVQRYTPDACVVCEYEQASVPEIIQSVEVIRACIQ